MTLAPSRARFPLLAAMFVGSGCAALIYEVVWFQLLGLVIGSSAISLGVLLATFMGGMCLGSLLVGRFVSPDRHPFRVYAWLELGIGVFGLLVLYAMPAIGGLYTAGVGHGVSSLLLRSLICIACLLPPTILMGATLPAIARWVGASTKGVSGLGFLYGANIAGGVLGCVLAGFLLLRVFDAAVATYIAVAINLAIGAVSLLLDRFEPRGRIGKAPRHVNGRQIPTPRDTKLVLLSIGLSGLAALGAQVVWTRFLALIFGGTVYTFSIILAVFLVGLGIGSGAGSYLARRIDPGALLGWFQLVAAVSIVWTAFALAQVLPAWPMDLSIASNPWALFQLNILQCALAILPATLCWGASFPLALAATARPDVDPARSVGAVYAANTVGAIVGAIGFSLLVVPAVGTQNAGRAIVLLSAVAAIVVLVPRVAGFRRLATIGFVGIVAAVMVVSVRPLPPLLVAFGYLAPQYGNYDKIDVLYVGEGMSSSVAVTEVGNGVRNFHVSGKIEASTEAQDMRLQRMLGNLPALLHPKPKSVLVVGFGAGVTAGSFMPYSEVENLTICEIEPLVIEKVGPFFAAENHHVLDDPRVTVRIDDARHFVRTTEQKFDVITSDPIHPWVKGAATLYTREYFEFIKARLKPGGVVSQWVPLYDSSADVVKSEIATFFEVFPNGTVWANNSDGQGYDLVLVGQVEPMNIDLDAVDLRIRGAVATSLREVGTKSAVDLLATYAGSAQELKPWLESAVINRDRNLRLQYLAGLRRNTFERDNIYREIVRNRQFPDDLFKGSEEALLNLRNAINLQISVPK